jgi:hypothetical protein
MAETKTPARRARKATAPKAATTQRRRAATTRPKTAVDRTTEPPEEVLKSVEDGERAAIEAVHMLVDGVDHTLPALPHGEGPSRRREISDSALEMADRLVHAQYDFVRKVVFESIASLYADPNETPGREAQLVRLTEEPRCPRKRHIRAVPWRAIPDLCALRG